MDFRSYVKNVKIEDVYGPKEVCITSVDIVGSEIMHTMDYHEFNYEQIKTISNTLYSLYKRIRDQPFTSIQYGPFKEPLRIIQNHGEHKIYFLPGLILSCVYDSCRITVFDMSLFVSYVETNYDIRIFDPQPAVMKRIMVCINSPHDRHYRDEQDSSQISLSLGIKIYDLFEEYFKKGYNAYYGRNHPAERVELETDIALGIHSDVKYSWPGIKIYFTGNYGQITMYDPEQASKAFHERLGKMRKFVAFDSGNRWSDRTTLKMEKVRPNTVGKISAGLYDITIRCLEE